MSTATAFLKAGKVATSLGLNPISTTRTAWAPATFARRILAADIAGIVPFPGRASPKASARQFMEFAVNIPAHEPHVGHASSSSSLSSASVMVPAFTLPMPSNTEIRLTLPPFQFPVSIGPPVTATAGMLSLSMAMSMPGVILSQFGTSARPSKGWACAMTSTESAINSLLARE